MKGRTLKSPTKGSPPLASLPSPDKLEGSDKLESSIGSLEGSSKQVLGAIAREEKGVEEDKEPVPPLKHSDEPEVAREDHDMAELAAEEDIPHNNKEEIAASMETEEAKGLVGEGTLEDQLNAIEVSSPQRQKAVSSQFVDRSFFASLAIKKSSELLSYPINDPLLVGANTGDSIDVQIILEEMGDAAARKINSRDMYGRTAVHIAAMGNSPHVVKHLMETYRRSAYSKFADDLFKLEREREASEGEITRALRASGNMYAGSALRQTPQIKSVHDWFENEVLRLQRSIEIRVEVNRAKILATKDKFGRTPVHYAAASGASEALIKALLTAGSANLNGRGIGRNHRKSSSLLTQGSSVASPSRASCGTTSSDRFFVPEKHWFDPEAVYETSTGIEIASVSGTSAGVGRDEKDGTRKSANVSATSSFPSMTTSLRNVAWELSGQEGNASTTTAEEEKQQVYEIMIPWVVRNLMRRVTELGSRESTSGITELEKLVDKHCSKPNNTLIIPELKTLLGKLGIHVTREVLRELCRRYSAESGNISDKWAICEEEQKREEERAVRLAEEKARLERLYGADFKHGMVDAKGDFAEGKDSVERSGLRGSKEGAPASLAADVKGGSGEEVGAKGGRSASESDTKGEHGGEGARRGEELDDLMSEKARETARIMLLEYKRQEADYGLDMHLLMTDIKSGKAFQPLYLTDDAAAEGAARNNRFSSSLNKGIDTFCDGDERRKNELSELLDESKDSGEKIAGGEGMMTSTQAKINMDHFGGKKSLSHSSTHCAFELPACVSVASIGRARKSTLDIADSFGRTPLLIASALGNRDVVSALVNHGADVSVSTPEGHSALSLAQGSAIRGVLEKALLRWLNDRSSYNALGNEKKLINTKNLGNTISGDEETQTTIHAMTNVGTTDKTLLGVPAGDQEARSKIVMGMKSHLKQLELSKWSYSRNPLSWAVNNGLTDVVRSLLQEKADVDEIDTVGRTALHECVTLVREGKSVGLLEESIKIAELLLEAGADVNKPSISLRTPFHELFCRGQDEASASFARLAGGAESYFVTEGGTDPLLKMKFKRIMVRLMLQWGADSSAFDRHGLGPIHYCAREDAAGCMVEMLRAGCDGGALTGHTRASALHVACKAGATRVCNLLCRWDADSAPGFSLLDSRDGTGKLPIQLLPNSASPRCLHTLWNLAHQGNLQRVSEILNKMKMHGDARWEDVEEENNDESSRTESGDYDNEEEKKDAGKDDEVRADLQVVQKDYNDEEKKADDSGLGGGTGTKHKSLDWAPRELWLLDGVDAKSRRYRRTALHSVIIGWAELEATGKPTSGIRSPGRAPLKINQCAKRALTKDGSAPKEIRHPAAPPLHKEVLQFLLANHAFVDAVDSRCRTPLMLAAATNLVEAVEILLLAGADVGAHDLDGNTPLHLAYAFGAASAVVTLEGAAADSLSKNHAGRAPLELAGKESMTIV